MEAKDVVEVVVQDAGTILKKKNFFKTCYSLIIIIIIISY
jgi:hypothetical protein